MAGSSMAFAIKARITDPSAGAMEFRHRKTMYGGKLVAPGDTIFLFDSENDGGHGLVAQGVVVSAECAPRTPGLARQTPRVSIVVRVEALGRRRLGRAELKTFTNWKDGQPATELNFKLYRQATDKIIGLSDEAAAFLAGFFRADRVS